MRPGHLALPLAALLIAACGGGSSSAAGSRSTPGVTAAAATPAGPAVKAYCLTDADQPQLVYFHGMWGAVVGTGTYGVVLTNQSGNDPCNWKNLVPKLEKAGGFRVLLYFYGSNLDEDIQAASDLLRSQGSTRVALVGASLGGAATLVAGSIVRPPPSAVISLSGEQAAGGENAMRTVSQLAAPTLILASEDDSLLTGDAARALFGAVGAADKKLQVYPGSDHGVDLFSGDRATEALDLVVQFLQAHGGSS